MSARRPDALPLPQSFYARGAERVARALLGQLLVSTIGETRAVGRIVETEAYIGPHDDASHAAERIGRTMRNESMFGPPGIAYVYRIYGVHWCLNVVTDRAEYPAAVLIRALEPIEGLDVMRVRRSVVRTERDLCSGPGKLAQALGITGAQDGHPLDSPPLCILEGARVPARRVVTRTRVGITRAHDLPLRFYERGNPHVSRW
ncbi:MAG TPA: DNA-3-methyladenine glycosylase [Longimicrobiales bacterium]|nr:DNA-3-methyladenine glycosylase [Longimicrobiales bacterium]